MRRPFFALVSAMSSLCIAFAAVSASSFGQATATAGSNALTLEQVIATADANYPAIKAAQAQQKAAQGEIAVAKTAYLPRTDILWQTDRATANNILGLLLPQSTIPSVTGSVLPSDPTRSAWNSAGGALLSWQPFDFGAREAKVEVARHGSEAAKQAAALTRLEVSANAGSAFFDLAAAERLVIVAQAMFGDTSRSTGPSMCLWTTRFVRVPMLLRQTRSLLLHATSSFRYRRRWR